VRKFSLELRPRGKGWLPEFAHWRGCLHLHLAAAQSSKEWLRPGIVVAHSGRNPVGTRSRHESRAGDLLNKAVFLQRSCLLCCFRCAAIRTGCAAEMLHDSRQWSCSRPYQGKARSSSIHRYREMRGQAMVVATFLTRLQSMHSRQASISDEAEVGEEEKGRPTALGIPE